MDAIHEILKLLEASGVTLELNIFDRDGIRVCSLEINPQRRIIRIKRASVLRLLRNVKLMKLLLRVRRLMKAGSAKPYSIRIELSMLKSIFFSGPALENGEEQKHSYDYDPNYE